MPMYGDVNHIIHKRGGLDAFYQVATQTSSGDPRYYGFVDSEGRWLIMEQNSGEGTFKWARGETQFIENWALRADLTYVYWNQLT